MVRRIVLWCVDNDDVLDMCSYIILLSNNLFYISDRTVVFIILKYKMWYVFLTTYNNN